MFTLLLLVGALHLSCPDLLDAQPGLGERARTNRVVVHHTVDSAGQVAVSGWVFAISDSTITLDTGEGFLTLDRDRVSDVELRVPPHREFGFLGIAVGAWLMNYAVVRHSNSVDNPTGHRYSTFLPEGDQHDLLVITLLSSAGAVPGGLLGLIADGLLVEEVHRYPADSDDSWGRLQARLRGVQRPWELEVETGLRLWSGGGAGLDARHATAGESVEQIPTRYGPVQWLRRAAVHSSVSPGLSLGLTYVDLSAPTRSSRVNLSERDHLIESTISLDGYAVSAVIRPFEDLPDEWDLQVGTGAGIATGRFEELVTPAVWMNSAEEVRVLQESVFSPFGFLRAEGLLHVTEGLGVGLGGDVAYVLPWEPSPLPIEGERPGERNGLSFSSASIGLVLAYRF